MVTCRATRDALFLWTTAELYFIKLKLSGRLPLWQKYGDFHITYRFNTQRTSFKQLFQSYNGYVLYTRAQANPSMICDGWWLILIFQQRRFGFQIIFNMVQVYNWKPSIDVLMKIVTSNETLSDKIVPYVHYIFYYTLWGIYQIYHCVNFQVNLCHISDAVTVC